MRTITIKTKATNEHESEHILSEVLRDEIITAADKAKTSFKFNASTIHIEKDGKDIVGNRYIEVSIV